MSSMAARVPAGRSALIAAAERLFAERGIEAVSLREIMRAAGQRNTTSLQYHFGDRSGLVRAVVDRHVEQVSLRRLALLDLLDDMSLRDAAKVLVQPLVAKLADPDGGAEFLRIAGQLVNATERVVEADDPVAPLIYDPAGSMRRWAELVDPLMPPGVAGPPLHRRYAAVRFTHLELARRAHANPKGDQALFSSHLTDLVCAILGTPLSSETANLLSRRPSRTHPPTSTAVGEIDLQGPQHP
ncbi:TetR family transcriptional regulator [Mycobacterium sp. UM_CSW]|uniref:TetR/AcrR family transcriptional regulator n=1 Tax=Mycobacterium sp. UM_CSW TaxID=1370119 RepID=UPI00195530B2|nr:TetR family transcriptional regulator [Mycobacterium sp. UM_CSW]